jgi:hypothetical protein
MRIGALPLGKLSTWNDQMKNFVAPIAALLLIILLDGCAGTTPIKSLALPPVTTIEGEVTQVDAGGFVLADGSGSIYVRAAPPDGRKLDLSAHDRVKVFGNLQGSQDRIFDGYVIRKASGEQIIVTNPTPHFGCIIQGSFQ